MSDLDHADFARKHDARLDPPNEQEMVECCFCSGRGKLHGLICETCDGEGTVQPMTDAELGDADAEMRGDEERGA